MTVDRRRWLGRFARRPHSPIATVFPHASRPLRCAVILFKYGFGLPYQALNLIAGLEVAAGTLLVTVPSIGVPAAMLITGGATYAHLFRQREPVTAAVALLVTTLLVLSMQTSPHLVTPDEIFFARVAAAAAFVLGGVGCAVLAHFFGVPPQPQRIPEMHAIFRNANPNPKSKKRE